MALSATQPPPGTAVFSKVNNGNGAVEAQKKQENPPQVQVMGRAKDGRNLKIRTYPQFASLEEREYRKQHLAAAFRVFADRGYDEGVAGHISVRDRILTDHFWLNPLSMHFSLIKVSGLILVDEDGLAVEGDEPINTAATRLRFYGCHAVYDSFSVVVVDRAEGERIAAALGPANEALILQNHGLLTAGRSVDEAAFWLISLERTRQTQLLADAAAAAGYEEKYISDEEAAYGVQEVGVPGKGWLAFQPYYDEQMAKTRGAFLC
ncbi:hypothetical protein DL771_009371 [Monosporascus sp. 5C6A]|nr:hypothetical protein DL771_009371 [Monosporascus sp. 5C6A]